VYSLDCRRLGFKHPSAITLYDLKSVRIVYKSSDIILGELKLENFAISESLMWEKPIKESKESLTDAEINEKYKAGEHRIVTETNREKIPNFIRALDNPDYMELRPFYQRRARWATGRQSLLIESFIMNIPVPPLFLYENDFNKYEVMDGQQRINWPNGYRGSGTL